jgi:probable F420-dependent oxidoreductase
MIGNRRAIWTAHLDFHPSSMVRDVVQELEELGYGSLWIGENVGREPFTQAGVLLAATTRLTVATAVANMWARDPLATLAAQYTLAEAYPDRFVLGLGVSHHHLVETVRGLRYDKPLAAMRDYLAAMDNLRLRYRATRPATELPTLYTPEEAASMLQVRASWLRRKATARAVPCTFIGKHLRFSQADLAVIVAAGSTGISTGGRRTQSSVPGSRA